MNDTIKKVNFSDYIDKYDENFKTKMETSPESIDIENMRTNLYGYTFTKEYADGKLADELSMDYWEDYHLEKDDLDLDFWEDPDSCTIDAMYDEYFDVSPQERLILQAIDSTGDGKTPETALCVIDVCQEYEYIKRADRFMGLQLVQQSVVNGIDCLEFKDHRGDIEKVYFDISRRFEVGFKLGMDVQDDGNESQS